MFLSELINPINLSILGMLVK